MKTVVWSFVLCTFVAVGAVFADAPVVDLFKDTQISAWDFYLEGDAKRDATFAFKDGVLTVTGKPNGWLCTKKDYKNFEFSVEYRWPEGVEPTNSGIFLRIHGEPINFLPRGIEVQLKHGNGGDVYGFHGFKIAGETPRATEDLNSKLAGEVRGVKRNRGNESKPGEWNRVSILCYEGLILIKWNDKVVNWAHAADNVAGKIGFQSEGGPIEFRNAIVNELE
ncbi:MAG: 3-keto-disaccharide hydrolase [Thermoguttaceae bacterium]